MLSTVCFIGYLFNFYILHKAFDIRSLHNPLVVFNVFTFLFLFIGGTYFSLYDFTEYSVRIETVELVMGAVVSGLLVNNIGFLLIFKFLRVPTLNIIELEVVRETSAVWLFLGSIAFSVGMVLGLFYLMKVGINIGEGSDDARIEQKVGNGKLIIAAINFIQVGCIIVVANAKSKLTIGLSLLMVLVGTFVLASFGNRFPALLFIICVLFTYMVKFNIELKLRRFLLLALSVFILFVLLGTLRKSVVDIVEISMLRLPWRPYVNFYNFETILDYFNKDFLYGYSYVIDLRAITPLYNENFGQWLKNSLNMSFSGGSVTYTYLGEGYLNFGRIGIYIYAVLYPMVMGLTYCIFFRVKSCTVNKFGILMLMSMALNPSVSSGLLPCLLYSTVPQLLIISTIWFCYKIIKAGKYGKNKL